MNQLQDDFKNSLHRSHIEGMTNEELADRLMNTGDPDAPGDGITRLINTRLAELLTRSRGA